MNNNVLNFWVIYDRPLDYPHSCVARRFELDRPTTDAIIEDANGGLERLRLRMQALGLLCLPRSPDDEPHIVECWV